MQDTFLEGLREKHSLYPIVIYSLPIVVTTVGSGEKSF